MKEQQQGRTARRFKNTFRSTKRVSMYVQHQQKKSFSKIHMEKIKIWKMKPMKNVKEHEKNKKSRQTPKSLKSGRIHRNQKTERKMEKMEPLKMKNGMKNGMNKFRAENLGEHRFFRAVVHFVFSFSDRFEFCSFICRCRRNPSETPHRQEQTCTDRHRHRHIRTRRYNTKRAWHAARHGNRHPKTA